MKTYTAIYKGNRIIELNSRVKADTIASLEQSILIKQIARLKLTVFNQVVTQIQTSIRS